MATYRSSTWNVPHLLLRARLRSATDARDNERLGSRVIAVLERQTDGTYKGKFELPSNIVYAAFAVEDRLGRQTDSHEGRFWDMMSHAPEGGPLLESLEQRFNDLLDRDDRPLLEIARTMVDLYPNRLESWSTLRAVEDVLGEGGAEELLAKHRERARYFDRLLGQTQFPNPDQIGYLFSYASLVREEAIADRWRERLKAEQPGHYFALVDEVFDLRRTHATDPTRMLRRLVPLWDRAVGSRARQLIVVPAFAAARQAGDAETILLWADHFVTLDPHRRSAIGSALAVIEATRQDGIRWLRQQVAALDPAPDNERPLGATRATFERESSARRAALQADLGGALLAAGEVAEAITVLEEAATVAWGTNRFLALGEARLSSGDTLRAQQAFALAASDPGIAASTPDSLRLRLGVRPVAWERARSDAKAEMLQRTRNEARSDSIPGIALRDRLGQPVPLESLLGEPATVLVFWSRHCSFSHQAMPHIVALAKQLRDQEVPLLALTHDTPAEAHEYLTKNGWELQVYHDVEREAARTLGNWATPQYFILDGSGRVRYAFTSIDDILRQVMALQSWPSN